MIIGVEALPALTDNYIYILTDEARNCVVIDPGEAEPVLNHLQRNRLNLHAICCTHHHGDHVDGAAALAQETGARVWCSNYDLKRIAGATSGLFEGQEFNLLGEPVQIIEIPGHTLGHIAYHLPRLDAVFVGDTMFSCGCGRLFEGTAAQMFASLSKIKALPSGTKIYFGHEYTLKNLEFTRALGLDSPTLEEYTEVCRRKRSANLPTTPARLEIEYSLNPFLTAQSAEEFAQRRARRDHF